MMGMMGTGVLVVMAVLMVKGYYHYYGDVTISSLSESTAVPQQLGVPSVFMGGYPLATAGVPGLVQRLVQSVDGYLRGYVDIPSSIDGGGLHPTSIPRVVSTGGLVGTGGTGSGGGGYQSSDENDKDDGKKIYKGHLKDHHNNNSSSTLASSSATSATATASSSIGSIKENNGNGPLKRSNSIASLLSSLPMMALEKVLPYFVTSHHVTSHHHIVTLNTLQYLSRASCNDLYPPFQSPSQRLLIPSHIPF